MTLHLSADDLRPIVQQAVAEVLSAVDGRLGEERIGYTEPEAAAAMGIPRHVLRDARLRGEVTAKRIGKRYVYARAALIAYLATT